MLPLIIWLLNFVSSVKITFADDYVCENTVKVFAGIAPMNANLLNGNGITVAVLGTYYTAWLSSIAGVAKFATRADPIFCYGLGCEAILLPGGVEQIRMFNKTLNGTMLNTDKYLNNDALVTHGAPAVHLEFSTLRPDFEFNRTEECLLTGEHNNQGLYTCVSRYKDAIVAGMTSCPTLQRAQNTCFTETTWTHRLQTNISMLAFERTETTVYDRNNLSIIAVNNMSPITDQSKVLYEAADFRYILRKLLVPAPLSPNTTAAQLSQLADDTTMIDATSFSVTWAMRLSSEVFHDDKSSAKDMLKGALIIPIHFTSSATMLANSTVENPGGPSATRFDLPDSIISTASGAKIVPRLRGKAWTVWSYIAMSTAMLLYSMILFGLILFGKDALLETSGFGDVDLIQKMAAGSDDETTIPGYLKARRAQEGNSKSLAETLEGTRLLRSSNNDNGRTGIVLTTV